jgi:hypothetical protein
MSTTGCSEAAELMKLLVLLPYPPQVAAASLLGIPNGLIFLLWVMVSSRLTAASLTKSTTAASGCYSVCNRSSGSSLVELAHAQQSQCAKYRLFHAVRL